MKHKKLLIVILVCIVTFVSSLTAGVVVLLNTIDFSKFSSPAQIREELQTLFDEGGFQFPALFGGKSVSMTIDESDSLDLTGIKTIVITGVADKIEVGIADSKTVDCSLTGTYFTFWNPITYTHEIQGDRIIIHPNYPPFGLINIDMTQQVLIPADYTGKIEIGTVSGACNVTGQEGMSWSELKFNGVSGSFRLATAELESINVYNVSGSIDVNDCTAVVKAETISGSINVDWQQFVSANLNTISGSIDLSLPMDAAFMFSFNTVSGSFSNNGLPIQMGSQSRTQTNGTMNDGTSKLEAGSISGSLVMNSK